MTTNLKNSSVLLFQDNIFCVAGTGEQISIDLFHQLVNEFSFLLARKSFYILTKERNGEGELYGIALTKKNAEEAQESLANKTIFRYFTRIHNQLFIKHES